MSTVKKQVAFRQYWFHAIRGLGVLKVNEFKFYELATRVHSLTEVAESAKYSEVWLTWHGAAEAIFDIFQQRALEFCFETANELYLALCDVVPKDFGEAVKKRQALPDPEPELGWSPTYKIRTAAEKFETLLSAELSHSDTYWISPKATHKTSMLLTSAHSLLPDSIIGEVPEAAADFDEAGRCWLFDTYTAVGFHLMRATEAVIRRYYRAATGVEPKVKFRNWGAYIKKLRECPLTDPRIVAFLEHMKDHYRNPILHPEQNLGADDANVLFGVCTSAIAMMALGIRALNEKGQALPLTKSATQLSE